MSFLVWLRTRRSSLKRQRPQQARRARPQLELLEDRLAPTVAAVSFPHPTLIADTAGDESRLDTTNSPLSATSADGRYVVFIGESANLVPGQVDANLTTDVFIRDRLLGTTALVSHSTAGATAAGDRASDQPVISADGQYVAFISRATNLVAGQVDPVFLSTDVFLYEVATGAITLVSHAASSAATVANGISNQATISADGRYVAFSSAASNLVTGQTGAPGGAFLFDRVGMPGMTAPGTIALVSHTPAAGNTTNTDGSNPAISADGKRVAFLSFADNLVAGQVDTNNQADVFLYDVATQAVTLVSHIGGTSTTAANGNVIRLAISSDDGAGNYHVIFHSTATNQVSGQVDANGSGDLFLYSTASGTVSLVSHLPTSLVTTGNGDAGTNGITISQNGQYVAFAAAARNLVTGEVDSNGSGSDLYLYERATGTVSLVSHVPTSSVTTGNNTADSPSIGADGSYIAFRSFATNLVTGQIDSNTSRDVFLFTRATGAVTLVSHAAGAATTAASATFAGTDPLQTSPPMLSADGNYVAFASKATNLSSGVLDTNSRFDVFAYERGTSLNTPVSVRAPLLPTLTGNLDSVKPSVSADGRYVAFQSVASNLAAGQVDLDYAGASDIFLLDRLTGTTALVSHASGSPAVAANGNSVAALVSADGKYVVFESGATNLVAGQVDANGANDLFLYEVATGTVKLINHRPGAPATTTAGGAGFASISADGACIAFPYLGTDLVAGQVGASRSVYLYNRATEAVTLVSHASSSSLTTGNADSSSLAISADGNWIAYDSAASNLVSGQVDANGLSDVFLYDRILGTNVLVSHAAGAPAQAGNNVSSTPTISADGVFVGFGSNASNLVPGQVGGAGVCLYNRATGDIAIVSHASSSPLTSGNGSSSSPAISADGNWVAYTSQATNLVAGQIDNVSTNDVFLYDRATGTNRLVSHAAGASTAAGNGPSALRVVPYSVGAAGNYVTFLSRATNLVPGQIDTNSVDDVFRYERTTDTVLLASHVLGAPTTSGNTSSDLPVISGDGSVVVFNTLSISLVAGDFNNKQDVFAFTPAPVNAAPTDITLSSNSVAENSALGTPIGTLSAVDPNAGDTHTFTLVTGSGDADNASFTITGNVLKTAVAPDFETQLSYTIRVRATDAGGLFFEKPFTIVVTDVNEPPIFTSGDFTVPENTTSAGTVTATDPEHGSLTYSITGGADQARFSINATTGALAFTSAPDFEAPTDANGDNVYEVMVQVSDGSNNVPETLTVTVTNVNEPPVITSGDFTVPENTIAAGTVTATDPEHGALTYSITGGADQTRFSINSATGALTFNSAPDFEAPADANGDCVYEVIVQVSDGPNNVPQLLTITVTNVNEPPVITSGNFTVPENTSAVGTVTATDPENGALTYSITGGADQTRFSINSATGALAFTAAPDFEAPADANGDNVYEVTVRVSDGTNGIPHTLTVTVTNVNEPPVITSGDFTVPENTIAAGTVTATDPENGALTYSIIDGADQARFSINSATGALTFNTAPDFEAPADANGDNVYEVTVQVSDGLNSVPQPLTVTVTNVNEPPTANAGGPYTVGEGGSVMLTGSASDPEQSAATIHYEWDLDGDSTFGETGAAAANGDETGPNPTFSAAGLDGPSSRTVTLRVIDSGALSDESTATIAVGNLAPSAGYDFGTTNEDEPITIDVLANDSDWAGALDPLEIVSATNGAKGVAAIVNNQIVYTPNAGATGDDTITYTITDGDNGYATATVYLHIRNLVDVSGHVFDDKDNDGAFEPADGDSGIGGTVVQLWDQSLATLIATVTTAADGSYAFDVNLGSGIYKIVAGSSVGYLDSRETAGNLGGNVDNSQESNQITDIVAGTPGTTPDAVDYLFARIRPSQAVGLVWRDADNDGQVDVGEAGIPGVTVELTGLDDRGNAVNRSAVTDADGIYAILNLRPSNGAGYTLHELQPAGYVDGIDTLGTVNGVPAGTSAANDTFATVVLPRPASSAEDYNFGERPTSSGAVGAGQSAGIGFWKNASGQSLIKSLNGGPTATALGNWLATMFPNMYGAYAGTNNLAGKKNTQVAAFYIAVFNGTAQSAAVGGPKKSDAQVLATALAVYVTDSSLAGNTAAAYGFLVTDTGLGARTYDVGSNNAAFGVAANAQVTVLDLLLAVNKRSHDGVLYDLDGDGDANDALETSYRTMANNVFGGINAAGGI